MTTVAFKDGVLAVDGRITSGRTVISDSYVKIIRTEESVFAISGDAAAGRKYVYDLVKKRKQGKEPRVIDDEHSVEIVEFTNEGALILHEEGGQIPLDPEESWAFGNGDSAAIAAMMAGASALQAVEIASRVRVDTGGDIVTVVRLAPGGEKSFNFFKKRVGTNEPQIFEP